MHVGDNMRGAVLWVTVAVLALGASSLDGTATSLTASKEADSPPSPEQRQAHFFTFDPTGMADEAASGQAVTIPLTPEKAVTVELSEFEMFLPGEKKVVHLGADGDILSEEPFYDRTFRGEDAFVQIGPTGLYGVIDFEGIRYSLQPLGKDGPLVLQEVSVVGAASLPPASPPRFLGEYGLWVKPYAEQSYVNLYSDWSSRINSAYAYAQTMWQGETIITLFLGSIVNSGQNFQSQASACNKDVGLVNFRNWFSFTTGMNSYGIFHAYDNAAPALGCGGINCAGYPSGCLSNSNNGANDRRGSHAVQGKDWSAFDSYNPAETYDLAVVTHHELTHNAGEPDHPGDGNWPCDYNLMANGVAIDCSKFWRTSGTQQRVKSYSYPRIHPP